MFGRLRPRNGGLVLWKVLTAMFARATRTLALFWLVAGPGCKALDPEILDEPTEAPPSMDAGREEASVRSDASVASDGGTLDSGDAAQVEVCRRNPDRNNQVCPDICPEQCNGKDDDCDRRIDEDGSLCDDSRTRGSCVDGQCEIDDCLDGHRDCDGQGRNGCEVAPDDPSHCGGCDNECSYANGQAECVDGECRLASCAQGYDDCDEDAGTGCETDLNADDSCGSCGRSCEVDNGSASCNGERCELEACEPGWADCDGDPLTGCEEPEPCDDGCPDDPLKTEPGACGCGVPEDSTDTDSDGAPDCADPCPDDPLKTEPGACGCGLPDADVAGLAACGPIRDALIHRYRFEGTGMTAVDSIAGMDATVMNATLSGGPGLALPGGSSDSYVDLPNGLLSVLANATLEMWVRWDGGGLWQRFFDFGVSRTGVEGEQEYGGSYLFVTPDSSRSGMRTMRVGFRPTGGEEVFVEAPAPLSSGEIHHVALVADDDADQLRLYVDGTPQGEATWTDHLSQVNDINSWLGRSQFVADDDLGGTVFEFRMYNAALSDSQIASSARGGPDPFFLD